MLHEKVLLPGEYLDARNHLPLKNSGKFGKLAAGRLPAHRPTGKRPGCFVDEAPKQAHTLSTVKYRGLPFTGNPESLLDAKAAHDILQQERPHIQGTDLLLFLQKHLHRQKWRLVRFPENGKSADLRLPLLRGQAQG
jgi:hypothetical protein